MLEFAIAVIPLAVYFLLLGALRLRTRPLLTTGWRDMLTLGIAVGGLVAVGPVQLFFFPSNAAAYWREWIWIALFMLYVLGLLMILLASKPRLVAYGLNEFEFEDLLLRAAQSVDPGASWHGNVLTLPNSRIQLAREQTGTARVFQVIHVGNLNNLQDWLQLERAFVAGGADIKVPRSGVGIACVLLGLLMLFAAVKPLVENPAAAFVQLQNFLNR